MENSLNRDTPCKIHFSIVINTRSLTTGDLIYAVEPLYKIELLYNEIAKPCSKVRWLENLLNRDLPF